MSLRERVIAQAKKTNRLRGKLIQSRKRNGKHTSLLRRSYHRARAELAVRRLALARSRDPRSKALKWAHRQVGTVERTGHNDGVAIRRWQRHTARGGKWLDGAPYCGIGCENACSYAGVKTVSEWASVAEIERMARNRQGGLRGWTTTPARARRGDLVVLFGNGIHVEILRSSPKHGVVKTIGFNTSPGDSGSQANGGGVFLRTRSQSDVHGFALVDYPN